MTEVNKEVAAKVRADFVENQETRDGLAMALTDVQLYCHGLAYASGWWHNKDGSVKDIHDKDFILAKLMLVVTEVAEAAEGARKGIADDHLPHRTMLEVECADAIIRILDLAGALQLNVGDALAEKLLYNQQRKDHKPEARFAEGGKAI